VAVGARDQDGVATLAVVGGTIVDGNGGPPLRDGVVVAAGSRIAAVGDGATEVPAGATQIDSRGKYVIPGLITSHVYLVDGTWPPLTVLYEGRYDEVVVEGAQLALKGGVTTVFDNWGPRDPLLKARDAVNRGQVTGARIFVCGNWIGVTGPFSDDMRPQFRAAVGETFAARIDALWEANVGEELTHLTEERVREAVRAYAESGVDFLTYPVNVHRTGVFQFFVFSDRVQRAIVEEGHRAGLPVRAIFATSDEGVRSAVYAGADLLVPVPWGARPLSPETVAIVAERKVPVFISAPPPAEIDWQRGRPDSPMGSLWEVADADARLLIGSGAVVCESGYAGVFSANQLAEWGSSGAPGSYATVGEGHIRGIRALVERGVSPMDALVATTRTPARAFGVDGELGTLEPGKLADLVVLDRDPLADPEHYRCISAVVKDGVVIDRDSLPTQRLMSAT
jgi:imidazolonepropionase-like amidohydrolase